MVAKSYQNLEIVKQPYMANGKMYVDVKTTKGAIKVVRWYSEQEYEKYYGEKPSQVITKTQKEVLGFVDGFITIFKGDTFAAKDWFKEHGASYKKWWGWSFASNVEVPTELPDGVEAVRLDWDLVGVDDKLKNDDAVKEAIENLIYEPSDSEYIGEIGERLELTLTVDKAIQLDGFYGTSTMHIMSDEDGNVYVWTTAAKSWEEGSEHFLRGTVKDHRLYKGEKETILIRCKEISK